MSVLRDAGTFGSVKPTTKLSTEIVVMKNMTIVSEMLLVSIHKTQYFSFLTVK